MLLPDLENSQFRRCYRNVSFSTQGPCHETRTNPYGGDKLVSRCEWESPPPDKYGEECSCRAGPNKKKTGGGLLIAVVALVLGSFNSVDEE